MGNLACYSKIDDSVTIDWTFPGLALVYHQLSLVDQCLDYSDLAFEPRTNILDTLFNHLACNKVQLAKCEVFDSKQHNSCNSTFLSPDLS